ncbi:O-methyltransferase, family 2 [Metarhizium guizhouense ARSEF 977]|uniref:O-methyltransferase, family 2 n=1 Tax=Metarhizium guizhouense (strain ARSEF 977) TaxID=1276136 RepID=A0A0B4GJL1_METGA|nr:O-methyltransferase, family 2 [Metarhizium guizhouense ARSEF 977]
MASPNTTPRIVALAAQISTSVAELQERLTAEGIASPSFAEDSPECLPANITNLAIIDTICRFHIADIIPPGGQVSFGDIAEKTGLETPVVRRLLRSAMAIRILREPEPGMVAHTKISKFLSQPYIKRMGHFEGKDAWPACARAFYLANNTDKSSQEAVVAVSKVYDWASLGNACIVNISGSRGQVAIELAKNFGNIKLLVQDAAMAIKGADKDVPEQLKERVQFMKYVLFDPQTVQANAYLFRMVFRN